MMCSRQVTRLLLRSASVTKIQRLLQAVMNLSQLAESDAPERRLNTESDTTRP